MYRETHPVALENKYSQGLGSSQRSYGMDFNFIEFIVLNLQNFGRNL
jgi:hypothetical protein